MTTLEERIEDENLFKLDPQPVWGEKCAHGSTPPPGQRQTGRWAVKLEDQFYIFEPGTQLQKDLWLMSAHDGSGEPDAYVRVLKLGALRWYCAQCGTVQEP